MLDLSKPFIAKHDLITSLQQLGLSSGQMIMVHASIKAVGNVMGGPNTVMQALLDTVTLEGTVMMYLGWEDIPDFVLELPEGERTFIYANYPPFEPLTARAARGYGVLAEVLRSWPGVQRSMNPEASMGAIGKDAAWLVHEHPLNFGYGAGSPLAKLVESGGQVLMLGAPLDTITLLHYAENIAQFSPKQTIHYQCPIMLNGKTVWMDIDDYNTGEAHADYEFEQIAHAYLATGKGRTGIVGNAQSYLFDARDLVNFAVRWLEQRFG